VIDFARFREIADAVGAFFLVDMAHYSGLVAAGVYPNPCAHADIVTSTTHKTLRGPRAGMILAREKFAKDIDRAVFPGAQGGPLVHVIAAKAVCFLQALSDGFRDYQVQVIQNARALAAGLQTEGFRVVSGGTDSHMFLIDVFSKGVKGKEAEKALDEAFITVNKNAIPFDRNPPMVASGIRIGTPAVTSRGMRESEMDLIAEYIARVLAAPDDDDVAAGVKEKVEALCRKFPLYPEPRN
jgi:glycine hydroxymethyltransferase